MPDFKREIQELLSKVALSPEREAAIAEELSQHLEERYEELVARGLDPEEAVQSARAELESGRLPDALAFLKRPARDLPAPGAETGANPFSGLLHDVRYGLRQLRLNPGFTAVAVLSLALGTGANTAIFQLLDAVRLRALPVEEPERLAGIRVAKQKGGRSGAFSGNHPDLTYALYDGVRSELRAFTSLAAWNSQRLNLRQAGEPRWAEAMWVSGGFFETFGLRPAVGRLLDRQDDPSGSGAAGGCGSTAVLGSSFWSREYGGSPSALGQTLRLNGQPFEIVGVAPAGFFGPEVGRGFDVALPLCAERLVSPEKPRADGRDEWWLGLIGRLAPGVSVTGATAQLGAFSRGLFAATLPSGYDAVDSAIYLKLHLEAFPAASGYSAVRRRYETPLWILMAISGLVLLIACANLANLMMARASARQREVAVRLALGASRARLVRQLVVESLLLASIGAALGAAVAQVLSRVLVTYLRTERVQLFLDLDPGQSTLLFSLALAVVTCLVFGLAPALHASRVEPAETIKAGGRGIAGRERFSVRRAFVVTQVALSLVLLVGALLFVRTLRNLTSLDAGFERHRAVVATVDFSSLGLEKDRRIAFKRELVERVSRVPGVDAAASVAIVPMSGSGWNNSVSVPGTKIEREIANFNQVSPGYFRAVGTPLLTGRDFSAQDTSSSPRVAIVTETFAKKLLDGADPVGRSFSVVTGSRPPRPYQIVGLVKDVKYTDLREEFTPIVYVAEAQDDEPGADASIVIRPERIGLDVAAEVRTIVAEVAPPAIVSFRSLETIVREALLRERLMATLSGFFGALAALLAMIGLYGVVSYMVVRRRNEIGVRVAVGAARADVLRLVLGEAGRLIGLGLAIGAALALLASTTAKALLFGLGGNDPLTLAAAIAGLTAVAIAASLVPAARAATLNPVEALRED